MAGPQGEQPDRMGVTLLTPETAKTLLTQSNKRTFLSQSICAFFLKCIGVNWGGGGG